MLPYGPELRFHRKLFHHALRADASLRQREIYLRRARVLLLGLSNDPEGFVAHIKGLVVVRSIIASRLMFEQIYRGDRHGNHIWV